MIARPLDEVEVKAVAAKVSLFRQTHRYVRMLGEHTDSNSDSWGRVEDTGWVEVVYHTSCFCVAVRSIQMGLAVV